MLIQIPMLIQIRRIAREIENVFEISRAQIVPMSHNLTTLSKEMNSILQSIHRQLHGVEEDITTVQNTAARMEKLHKIGDPLLKFPALVPGVISVGEAFARAFFR